MYTAYTIADYFLCNIPALTNKKLQKLVYYAYAWHLVLSNDSVNDLDSRLFENEFEAWVHGAVTPKLYNKYKVYGSGIIPVQREEIGEFKFSTDEEDILRQVIDVYGKYNGNELESINHQELPWKNARKGLGQYEPSHNLISDTDIYKYYSERLTDE